MEDKEKDTPISDNLEGREEDWEKERLEEERDEQEDLNQGMATGTHDSAKLGVDWGPSYRTRRRKKAAASGSSGTSEPSAGPSGEKK